MFLDDLYILLLYENASDYLLYNFHVILCLFYHIGISLWYFNYLFSTGTVTPSPCDPGTYRDTPGAKSQDECYPCEGGHYCHGTNNTASTGQCSEGFYCPAEDSISQRNPTGKECPAGYYCPEGSVQPTGCPAGKYVLFCSSFQLYCISS